MAAIELYSTTLYSDANLKAYYRFNNGALLTDSKGSYNLTDEGSVANSSNGKFDYAADFGSTFGGVTKRLYTNNHIIRLDNTDWTISVWLKINTAPTGGQSTIWHNATSETYHYRTFFAYQNNSGTNRLAITFERTDVANDQIFYNVDLGTGTYHHIVVTRGSGYMKLYIDGAYVDQVASSGSGTGGPNGEGVLWRWGRNYSDSGGFMLDDAAVFDRVLSASEISQVFNPTSIKTWNGITDSLIKTVNGVSRSSVKTRNGLS